MKGSAAAAVAAVMTLSTFAPAAGAASNKISHRDYVTYCTLDLETEDSGTAKQVDVQRQLQGKQDQSEFLAGSSKIGEAFGSSTSPEVEDFLALKACADGKDYQTTPLNQAEKAGIIIGVILGVLATLAPMVALYVKKYLPF